VFSAVDDVLTIGAGAVGPPSFLLIEADISGKRIL